MNKFKNCPVIEVGDVFSRVDKNGKVWEAKVVNRTEYYVDVEKKSPYKVKIGDEWGCWHYEDPKPTIERAMIHRVYEEIEDGEEEAQGLHGKYMKKKYKKVPTAKYVLDINESYVKRTNYDYFKYSLIKYEKETEDAQVGLDLFYKYCEEN